MKWVLHLLEKNKAASQQGVESRLSLMEEGGLGSSQDPNMVICSIDFGRWPLGRQINKLEIE